MSNHFSALKNKKKGYTLLAVLGVLLALATGLWIKDYVGYLNNRPTATVGIDPIFAPYESSIKTRLANYREHKNVYVSPSQNGKTEMVTVGGELDLAVLYIIPPDNQVNYLISKPWGSTLIENMGFVGGSLLTSAGFALILITRKVRSIKKSGGINLKNPFRRQKPAENTNQ